MKHNIIAAAILASGLVLAAFVHSGRYYAIAADKGVIARVDRWTGETKIITTNSAWWNDPAFSTQNSN